MWILIVPAVALIVGILMVVIDYKKVLITSVFYTLGICLIVISIVAGATMLAALGTEGNVTCQLEDAVEMKAEYEFLSENTSKMNISTADFDSLILARAIEYNKKIEKHKKWIDSPFIGKFYNPFLAEFKLIDIPK